MSADGFVPGSLFIRNDSDVPFGIHHVFDRHHPMAPLGEEPEERIDPGESIVLFKNPGVSYVIGHLDSLQRTQTKTTVLKDGTVRRDTKEIVGGWNILKDP
jgi:hypothetical protein